MAILPKPHFAGIFILCLIAVPATINATPTAAPCPDSEEYPAIELWYGDNQVAGASARAQRWVNVLGNVTMVERVSELRYTLNGTTSGVAPLGPDGRRLSEAGDFNIELNRGLLAQGSNDLHISVLDSTGCMVDERVSLYYDAQVLSLPLTIPWDGMGSPPPQVAVVDGFWQFVGEVARTHPDHIGYDRVLAIGDSGWQNYEILASVMVKRVDDRAYESLTSVAPSLGIDVHWQGHTNNPIDCEGIHCGWMPTGATFRINGDSGGLNGVTSTYESAFSPIELREGQIYWFRIRTNRALGGQQYLAKVWTGARQDEPSAWTLNMFSPQPVVSTGSFLLVAHHVDASFGPIEIFPIKDAQMGQVMGFIQYLPGLLIIIIAGVGIVYIQREKFGKSPNTALAGAFILLGMHGLLAYWLDPRINYLIQTRASGYAVPALTSAKDMLNSGLLAAALLLILRVLMRRPSQ